MIKTIGTNIVSPILINEFCKYSLMSKHFDYLNSTVCAFTNSLRNIHVYIENICLWKKSATYFSHMITNFMISNLEITVHHEYSGLFEHYYHKVVRVRMILSSLKPTFKDTIAILDLYKKVSLLKTVFLVACSILISSLIIAFK